MRLIKLLILFVIPTYSYAYSDREYAGWDTFYSYSSFKKKNFMWDEYNDIKPQSYIETRYIQRAHKLNAYYGYDIGYNTSIEAGAFAVQCLNSTFIHRDGHLRLGGLHASSIVSFPLYNLSKLFFGAGFGYVHASFRDNKYVGCNKNKFVPRFTAGMEWYVSDITSFRSSIIWYGMNSFQTENFRINNHLNFGFGLNYRFK